MSTSIFFGRRGGGGCGCKNPPRWACKNLYQLAIVAIYTLSHPFVLVSKRVDLWPHQCTGCDFDFMVLE